MKITCIFLGRVSESTLASLAPLTEILVKAFADVAPYGQSQASNSRSVNHHVSIDLAYLSDFNFDEFI